MTQRLPGLVWWRTAALGTVVLAIAIFAGMQFANTDKRILQVAAAGLLVYMTFRSRLITGLALAVLFLPFPKGTSYGTTNMAFMLLIFLAWIFRVTTGRARTAGRMPVDLPILGLVMAYSLSFYNVALPEFIPLAWGHFMRFLTYIFLLYLVVNIVRTTADVRKILIVQCISCLLVCLFALFEQFNPGSAIIPGWIDFSATYSTGHGVRVGSTFLDYELFGEYCALNLIVQLFMLQHASSVSRKAMIGGLMVLTFYCLLATVTRGALITFMAGLVYLAWLSRTRLSLAKLTAAVCLVVGLIAGGDFVMSTFTASDSVLERLFKSELVNGMPDTRGAAWIAVWEEVMKSPVIGHGPYYSIEKGMGLEWWPHNVYLYYAYIVGFVGLFFFLWILRELWRASRPLVASMNSGTYIQGTTVLVRVLLFMFMLDQTKIDYLRNGTYSFFVWFLFGLILAISNVARLEAAQPLALIDRAEPEPAAPERVRASAAVSSRRMAVSATPAVSPRNS